MPEMRYTNCQKRDNVTKLENKKKGQIPKKILKMLNLVISKPENYN